MLTKIAAWYLRRKQFTPPGTGMNNFLLNALMPRTKYDYASEVGDGITSGVIMAPIQWVQRAFIEAPLRVWEPKGEELEPVTPHDMTALIEKPNPLYSGSALWFGSLFSWYMGGNVYLVKVRNGSGRPVQLWYVPHWLLWPESSSDGRILIARYRYGVNGAELPPEDVIHIRHGIDPRDPRLGISPIVGILREIWTDNECSNWVASVARNMGVPGMVISPEGETALPGDVDTIKEYIKQKTTGDKRGEPLVFGAPTKVQQMTMSPANAELHNTRDVSEERVCAAIGIPAAVVGFGSGLQQTKVGATMEELRKLAWHNGIIPVQTLFSEEIKRSLLLDFEPEGTKREVAFDQSKVKALQESEDARATRVGAMVTGGWVTVAEGRRMMQMEADESHEIYLRNFSVIEVPAGEAGRQIGAADPNADPDADPDLDEEEDDDPPKRVGGKKRKKAKEDHHTLNERIVLENAPRAARIPRALSGLAARLEREGRALEVGWSKELSAFFNRIGKEAEAAIRPILSPKNANEDEADTRRAIAQMNWAKIRADQLKLYEAQYLRVAESTFRGVGEAIGLATDLPDPIARKIVEMGGRHAGLVDLEEQAKEAMFEALNEGRSAGEGVDALVRRIREDIPRGPWRDSQTRARVIARTETKYAQNQSTVLRARDMDRVEHMMVFDARRGSTDAVCEALNGRIVTVREAEQLAADEHPNGTRSFSPVPAGLLAELTT